MGYIGNTAENFETIEELRAAANKIIQHSHPEYENIGGGTQWQAVKTSNYTAAAGQGVFANTTSGSFTVTLPAGTLGDEVTIVDYAGTFDSNALTVAANGSEKIFGSTDDLTVSTERAAFTLVFTDSTQGWLFKND